MNISHQLTVTVLGCGNSAGTPTICNYWGNCDPAEPRNRRTRPAIAVQSATTTLIVDSGPDLREQVNRENITSIDAILYTHAHGDHISGIDDLRVLRQKTKKYVHIHGNRATIEELQQRFDYLFMERTPIYPRVLEPHILETADFLTPQAIGDVTFTPFEQDHGTCASLGYRFGDLAYSTDLVRLDEKAVAALSGIKTWIIDGAGYKMPVNEVHLTFRQIFALNEIVKAEKVYITHLSPAMDYQTMRKELPEGYEPCWDGLKLQVSA